MEAIKIIQSGDEDDYIIVSTHVGYFVGLEVHSVGECMTVKKSIPIEENLQLIQALEVAQKELDPSYQTREELQTQLTEMLNRANG